MSRRAGTVNTMMLISAVAGIVHVVSVGDLVTQYILTFQATGSHNIYTLFMRVAGTT